MVEYGKIKSLITAIVCACFFLSCASMGMNDQDATKTQGVVGGAALGALIGQIIGRDTKSTVIGAAIGGIVGGVVGNEVAKRKSAYKNKEDMIAKETERTRQFIAELEGINNQLRDDIAAYNKKIDALIVDYNKRKASKQQLIAQKKEVERNKAKAEKMLQAVEKELKVSQQLLADAKTSKKARESETRGWLAKINELGQARDELKAYIGELTATSERIPW